MGSNFHYSIDLNEDQNHQEQPFYYPLGSSSSILHHNHQVLSNSSASSSSISSLSSYLPFFINSQEDQHVSYNNTTYHADHFHLSQPLKAKMIVANGGSSSSTYDHMVPKKETRLKLTTRKKDHEDQTDPLYQNQTNAEADSSDKWLMSPKMRLIKKSIMINNTKQAPTDQTNNNNHYDHHYPLTHKTNLDKDHDEDLNLKKVLTRTTSRTMEDRYNTIKNGYGNNNGVTSVCSDCNTTKTPLWRSGPRGPKSLCNACGIRQRKARRAAMAAAAAAGDQEVAVAARLQQLPLKKKSQNKKKRSNLGEKYNFSPPLVAKAKKCKTKEEEDEEMEARDSEISKLTTSYNYSNSSNKLCFDYLTMMLSKSSAYQQMFPHDEKEAAILLMALSYGMVHG